jgi:hypothetical protein
MTSEQLLSSPLIVALFAFLALGLDSYITALLRKAAGEGIKPQAIVWGVSGVFVAIAMVLAGTSLPAFIADNPSAWIAAWAAIVTGWAGLTAFLYEILFKRWWPTPVTPPEPTF